MELVGDGVARAPTSRTGWVTPLDHEPVDDPVEDDTVIETLFHQVDEVLGGLGGLLLEEVDGKGAVIGPELGSAVRHGFLLFRGHVGWSALRRPQEHTRGPGQCCREIFVCPPPVASGTFEVLAASPGSRVLVAGVPQGSDRMDRSTLLSGLVMAAVVLLAGCMGALELAPDDSDRVLARHLLDAPSPLDAGAFPVGTLHYGSGNDKNRPEYRDSVAFTTPRVNASKLVSLGATTKEPEPLLGLHARFLSPECQGLVSRRPGSLPPCPGGPRQPRHEGLLRSRLRVSGPAPGQPRVHPSVPGHELRQREPPGRERRPGVALSQTPGGLEGLPRGSGESLSWQGGHGEDRHHGPLPWG
jgi:hypothetical protein